MSVGTCSKCRESRWPSHQPVYWEDPDTKRGYCLFHAPVSSKLSVSDYNSKFSKLMREFVGGKYGPYGPIDIDGVSFPFDIAFRQIFLNKAIPDIIFRNVYFNGKADFSDAVFSSDVSFCDTVFDDEIDFRGAIFAGKVSFLETTFKRRAYFDDSGFYKGLLFFVCNFLHGFYFSNVKVCGGVSVIVSEFNFMFVLEKSSIRSLTLKNSKMKCPTYFRGTSVCTADFQGTVFHENVDFSGFKSYESSLFNDALFNAGVYFHSSLIGGVAKFERARFKDYLSFSRSRLYCRVSFYGAYFCEDVSFDRVAFSGKALFDACSAKGVIKLHRVEMSKLRLFNAPLESFRFICCEWQKINGHNVSSDHENRSAEEMEDVYRRLKKSAKDSSDELLTSEWHWQEKDMSRKNVKEKHRKDNNSVFLWTALSLYKTISGYGEEPLRAFVLLISCIFSPLLVLGLLKLYETGVSSTIDWSAVKDVLLNWLYCMPMADAPKDSGGLSVAWICWIFRVMITLMSALFAFSLRNKLRR